MTVALTTGLGLCDRRRADVRAARFRRAQRRNKRKAGDRTCRGADEIARYFEDVFRGVPDFHIEIVALAEQGEHVFVHWRLTGTHRGYLLGIAPTGRKLAIDGVDHFTLGNGVILSNFVIFDQMQYARQIGMMPPDGSAADTSLKSAFNVRTKLMANVRRSAT